MNLDSLSFMELAKKKDNFEKEVQQLGASTAYHLRLVGENEDKLSHIYSVLQEVNQKMSEILAREE